jgi:hypothetical protein
MKQFPRVFARWFCVAASLVSFALTSAQAQADKSPIAFHIRMPRPWTHLMEVEMRVPVSSPGNPVTDLSLPVWTPGSYLLREYARNVQDFTAVDQNGKPISWHKINKNTWRLETRNAQTIVASYRVYANVLSVREAELNDAHAFWNNAALLMHVPGRLQTPATRPQPGKSRPVCLRLRDKPGPSARRTSIRCMTHRSRSVPMMRLILPCVVFRTAW